MGQRIDLIRKVYDKDKYQNTIDTSFNELTPPTPFLDTEPEITITQFFEAYNNLFFDIPKTGPNSHNELIQRSSEYVDNEQTNLELDALYSEINSLREQLLETQTQLIEAQQTQLTQGINIQ
jgi:hypothetical protein